MTLHISIGGVAIVLRTDNPAVGDLMAERMQGFITDGPGSNAIELELDLRGTAPSHVSVTELPLRSTADGDLVMETADGRAEVRRDNSSGWLRGAFVTQSIDALIRLVLSRALVSSGGLLLHASSVDTEFGTGACFVGPSGSGKSTIAEVLGLPILSDEAVVLGLGADGPFISGTPYWKGTPRTVPLGTVVFIERGPLRVEPLPPSQIAGLLFQSAGPLPKQDASAALEVAARLAISVPRALRIALEKRSDIITALAPMLRP